MRTEKVDMNVDLLPLLAELRNELKGIYGPRLVNLILFGSQARGDAEPGSDVDVLVVLKGDTQPSDEIGRTGQAVADLSLKHNAVISCVFMDEDRYLHRNGPLLRNIRREGVPV